MARTISIMTLPAGAPDALPQYYLEKDGVWRDVSHPLLLSSPISASTLRKQIGDLLLEMANQMRLNPIVSWAQLLAKLRECYKVILPEGIRAAIRDALADAPPDSEAPLLRIHQHVAAEWIPWELLNDGENFLGLCFRIARLPIAPSGPRMDALVSRRVKRVFNLLGENVFDPPLSDELTRAWRATFSDLLPDSGQETRYPNHNANPLVFPDVDDFMIAASQGDIVHVTCHGDFSKTDNQLYWTLNRFSQQTFTYHITATILNDLNLTQAPLIFGNACYSSAAGESSVGLASGFGSTVFARGALAYIGAFAPITQAMAVKFARRFYETLLGDAQRAGVAVGQALLETKKFFKLQNETDPSYLYYTLYGAPETRFIAG